MKKFLTVVMILTTLFLSACQNANEDGNPLKGDWLKTADYTETFSDSKITTKTDIQSFVEQYIINLNEVAPLCENNYLSDDEYTRSDIENIKSGVCEYNPISQSKIELAFNGFLDNLIIDGQDIVTNQLNISEQFKYIVEMNDNNLRITSEYSSEYFQQYIFK
ncbi:MAG: hypothetical protein JEZ05_07910 [Tenericutes bacterium]|nr:hypothetical protein [Mycoplasmatota bacterium]